MKNLGKTVYTNDIQDGFEFNSRIKSNPFVIGKLKVRTVHANFCGKHSYYKDYKPIKDYKPPKIAGAGIGLGKRKISEEKPKRAGRKVVPSVLHGIEDDMSVLPQDLIKELMQSTRKG